MEEDIQRLSNFKSLFVCLILLLPFGVPLNFINVPLWQSCLVLYGIILMCWGASFFKIFIKKRPNFFQIFPLIFVAYIFVITVIYNTATFQNSVFSWAPGLIYVTPMTLFVAYETFDITPRQVARGMIMAGVLCSLFTVVDQFHSLSVFDQYVRTSYMDKGLRRVVVAKNEQCFSFVLLISMILTAKNLFTRCYAIIAFMMLAYSLIVVAESRLALAALVIGTLLYIAFISRRWERFVFMGIMAMAALTIGPIYFDKYSSSFTSADDLQKYDVSVVFRLKEMDVFRSSFEQSNGLGFGVMYINERLDNVLSSAMYRMGTMYGSKNYPMGLADIGFFGALYQFGYIGLAFAVVMTFIIVFQLLKAGRDLGNPDREIYGVMGCMTLAFLISPLPMNFITLDWTMTLGGTLWYMACRANRKILPV